MASLPSPPPLPPPPPSNRAVPSIAWPVILAAASFMVVTTQWEKSARTSDDRPMAAVEFRLAARYAVGVGRLFRTLATPDARQQATSLLPQVDGAAKTPDDQLHAAIVAGEVAGPEAATDRLARLPAEAAGRADVRSLETIYRDRHSAALSAGERDALLDLHGWYGRLAVSHGKCDGDPDRRAALAPAVRTAVTMVGALGAGAAAMLTGLVLLVVLLFRWLDRRMVTRYHPPRGGTGPFLEAFALYLAGMAGLSALARLVLGERVSGMWFMVAVLPLACAWPLLRGVSRGELRQGLGLHAGRGLWREVGAGFVGYLATLPVLAAGAVVTLLIQRFTGTDASHPIVGEFGRGGWRTTQLFFLAAVWAPAVEEVMFRGAFYHHLRSRLAWPLAAGTVALIFAAIHPQGWAGVPVLAAIAFSFAFIREWRGSIVAPVVAHALNNGAVTLLMVLMLS